MSPTSSSADWGGQDPMAQGYPCQWQTGEAALVPSPSIQTITYNHLNLPSKVDFGAGKYITYLYDAAGIKLQQKVYENNALKKTTDYSGPFIYENDTLQFIQHDEGRIIPGPDPGSPYEYQYNLKDHLGNVRLTFTTKDQPIDEYLATMETAVQSLEEPVFANWDATRKNDANFDHTNVPGPPPSSYSAMLNATTGAIIGPAASVEIMAGDTVSLEVYAKYATYSGTNTNAIPGSTLISAIAAAFTPPGASAELTQQVLDQFNFAGAAAALAGIPNADGAPAAYLNYVFFDESNTLDGTYTGYKEISTAAEGAFELLQPADLVFNKTGRLYVYVSNETNENVNVYFDDLKITHRKSRIVQKDDYYPFGLSFNSYQRMTSKKNDNLYNGKELQEETNWMDYGARMYMADIGRWGVVDPLSEMTISQTLYHYVSNNPVSHIDPFGLYRVYVNGKRVRGKKKKAIINEYGLPTRKKGKREKDPTETVNGNVDYADGAIVMNEFGAYQNQNGRGLVDLSFNPSVGLHNRTKYLYSKHDLRVRDALLYNVPNNPITAQILFLEQKGIYIPLSSEDYLNNFYKVFGDDSNPSFWIGGQYLQMTMDIASGVDAIPKGRSVRRAFRSMKRTGRTIRRANSSVYSGGKGIRNRWNRFLHKTKGDFRGKYWLRDARKAYYNWRLGK